MIKIFPRVMITNVLPPFLWFTMYIFSVRLFQAFFGCHLPLPPCYIHVHCSTCLAMLLSFLLNVSPSQCLLFLLVLAQASHQFSSTLLYWLFCSVWTGKKYYIYFINNLLLFPTVKKFSKLVNSWWSYRKKFDTSFFLRHSVFMVLHRHSLIKVAACLTSSA